jgi:uncharacterized protein involved in outer membrane biogenesis
VALQGARVPALWPARLVLDDVRIGAPDWAESEWLTSIERVRVTANPPHGWADGAWIERVHLERPRLNLELHTRYGASWRAETPATSPPGWAYPDEFVVRNGRLTFRDPTRDVRLELRELRARARPPAADAPMVEATGVLNDEPMQFALAAQPEGDGYSVDITIDIGRTAARAQANVTRPWFGDALAVELQIEAPSLADLPQALPGEWPATGGVRLAGTLARTEGGWAIRGLDARLGGTRVFGHVAYLSGEPRARVEGELRAAPLDVRDGPRTGAFNRSPRRLAAKLGRVDADLRLRVDAFAHSALPLERLTARLRADRDRLRMEDLSVATAGGRIAGTVALARRDTKPELDARLRATDLQLGNWLGSVERLHGAVSGEVDVQAAGDTVEEMTRRATGSLELVLGAGTVRRSIVERVGLDVTSALLLPLADRDMAVRCALLRGPIAEGRLQLERAALGTPTSVLVARGAVDLAERRLDLGIEARAKDFSLFDAAAPVRVRGPWRDPEIVVGRMDELPFFELGDTQPLDCDAIEE